MLVVFDRNAHGFADLAVIRLVQRDVAHAQNLDAGVREGEGCRDAGRLPELCAARRQPAGRFHPPEPAHAQQAVHRRRRDGALGQAGHRFVEPLGHGGAQDKQQRAGAGAP